MNGIISSKWPRPTKHVVKKKKFKIIFVQLSNQQRRLAPRLVSARQSLLSARVVRRAAVSQLVNHLLSLLFCCSLQFASQLDWSVTASYSSDCSFLILVRYVRKELSTYLSTYVHKYLCRCCKRTRKAFFFHRVL